VRIKQHRRSNSRKKWGFLFQWGIPKPQNHGLKKWLKKWLVTWMRKLLGLKEQHAVEVKTTVWGPHGEQQSQFVNHLVCEHKPYIMGI
jgi:hypothetical protein